MLLLLVIRIWQLCYMSALSDLVKFYQQNKEAAFNFVQLIKIVELTILIISFPDLKYLLIGTQLST